MMGIMTSTRQHTLWNRPMVKIGAGVLAAACVAVMVFVVSQAGAYSFDPSAFFDQDFNQRNQPDYSATYDVKQSDSDGEASVDSEDETKDNQPDVQQVNAPAWSQNDSEGLTAFSVGGDGSSGLTLAGNSGNGTASSNGTVSGPVVNNGTGNGGEGTNSNPNGGTTGGNGSGNNDPNNPNTPTIVDPDPAPTLPDDLFEGFVPTEPFPEGGLPTQSGGSGTTEDPSISFVFTPNNGYKPSGVEYLYYGMVLNEWKILCATYFYVIVDGTYYRLEEFSDNFYISSELPQVLESDTLEVTFQFRLNEQSKWIAQTVQYDVKSYRVTLAGWEDDSSVAVAYLSDGESLSLLPYYATMLGVQPGSTEALSNLFLGWAETKDGASVGAEYTPTQKGRTTLYPLPLVPIPPGFQIEYNYWTGQTLVGYTGDNKICVIPEGVQAVDTFACVSADTISIPSTLTTGVENLYPQKAYQVSADNPAYYMQDGMLFETAMGSLVGIPSSKESVKVPAGTPAITIPAENSITRIEFVDKPNYVDFSNLKQCEIVVPDDLYLDFVVEWGEHPGDDSNNLVMASGSEPQYVVSGNNVLSTDGTILYQVLPSAPETYFIPDGVTTVAEGAFDNAWDVEIVFVPASVQTLEVYSMRGTAITDVFFEGSTPPSDAGNSFDMTAKLHVRPAAVEAFAAVLSDVYGADVSRDMLVEDNFAVSTVQGYQLLKTDAFTVNADMDGPQPQLMILKAPADVVEFTGTTLTDALNSEKITALAAGAFRDCISLTYAELPAEVKSIGSNAFVNCASLEALVARSTDVISIGSNAFGDCWSMRYSVFFAHQGYVVDWWSLSESGYRAFAPAGSTGFENLWDEVFDTSCYDLQLDAQGGGSLLYGKGNVEIEEDKFQTYQFLLGATSNVRGDIKLLEGTEILYAGAYGKGAFAGCSGLTSIDATSLASVTEVQDNAFYGCANLASISFTDKLTYVGNSAFYGCTSLTSATFTNSLIKIEDYAFSGCSALESVVLSQNMSKIGSYAFSGCSSLTHVSFGQVSGTPTNELLIDPLAFSYCSNLKTFDFPANTVQIGSQIFFDSPVEKATFCSATPPVLERPSVGFGFIFGSESSDTIHITLKDPATADAYINIWKYYLVGCDPADELTPEQDLEGQNLARALLGKSKLDSLPDATSIDTQSAQDERDGDAATNTLSLEEQKGQTDDQLQA